MEWLSIELLADLKIAIKKNEKVLAEKEARNSELTQLNSQFVETNKRLEQEINLQDDRITEAKAENETLRKEKEWVLSKFAQDNEKVYKELREKEEKISWDTQQNALRLIEIEKREFKLMNKEDTNTNILNESKDIRKEIKKEAELTEQKIIFLKRDQEKNKKIEEQIDEKNIALKEVEKSLNDKKLEINEIELKILESSQINQNLVAELQNKDKINVIQIERLEKLNTLFSELKGYVTEKTDATMEDIETFIKSIWKEDVVSTEKLEPQSDTAITKDTVILSEMKYGDLQKEVKKRWLDLPQNSKKEDLIDLLSK